VLERARTCTETPDKKEHEHAGNGDQEIKMASKNTKGPVGLPEPLPPTSSIPAAGWHFFGASPEASYRMARGPDAVIPTIATGSRNRKALPRVLAQRLERDPKD
jgi:hypothetical protein